jgi:hypothetical protein
MSSSNDDRFVVCFQGSLIGISTWEVFWAQLWRRVAAAFGR